MKVFLTPAIFRQRKRALIPSTLFIAAFLPSAHAQQPATCSPGVALHLSAPSALQGSLLLAELKSAEPLSDVEGDWNEKKVPFWQESGQPALARGLLGVDLEKAAGKYEFKVKAVSAGGKPVSCTALIAVSQGHFATERLQVEKQFVEPDPQQIKRAEAERQKLRDLYDTVTPERLWDGPFRVPLDGVTSGTNFGKRRILNGNPGSPHGGVDLHGTTGTPVHAAQRGRVVLAEELFFSGNTVVVDHGLGLYTFYAHFSEIDIKAGDLVEAGTVLGKVGATGRVTGPHLHWGLSIERARVNPLELVRLLGEPQPPPASIPKAQEKPRQP